MMKKKLISVFLASLLILGTTFLSAGAQSPVQQPNNLLVLGDSISSGYGLPGSGISNYAAAGSYANQLASSFGLKAKVNYLNLAQDGDTTSDLIEKLQVSSYRTAVGNADTIVMTIGANNLLGQFLTDSRAAVGASSNNDLKLKILTNLNSVNKILAYINQNSPAYQQAINSFESDIDNITLTIKRINPHVRIYIQTIYNPFSGIPGLTKYSKFADTYIVQMNSIINSRSNADAYTVIDTYGALKNKSLYLLNCAVLDIHQNVAGHTVIYKLLYKAILYR